MRSQLGGCEPPSNPLNSDRTHAIARDSTSAKQGKNAVSAVPIATKQDQLFLGTRGPMSFVTQHPTLLWRREERHSQDPLRFHTHNNVATASGMRRRELRVRAEGETRRRRGTTKETVCSERALSPICSPRVRHAQTLFRSPATLSLHSWVTSLAVASIWIDAKTFLLHLC